MRAFQTKALGYVALLLLPSIGLAQSNDLGTQQNSDTSYQAGQALDGFGAVLVGIGEPIFFPIDQAKECKRETGDSVHAGGCAFVGLIASPFLAVRDVLVGAGDILTGGYFTISRNVGVFDYFAPAAPISPSVSSETYNRGQLQNPASGAPAGTETSDNSYPGYKKYPSEKAESIHTYRRKNGIAVNVYKQER